MNVHPLVRLVQSDAEGGLTRRQLEEIYAILGSLLLEDGVVKPSEDVYYPELSVASGLIGGNVTVTAKSALLLADPAGWMSVEGGSVSILLENVTAVGVCADGNLSLSTPMLSVPTLGRNSAGSAFYLPLEMDNLSEFSLLSEGRVSLAIWSGSVRLLKETLPPGTYRMGLGGNASWAAYLRRPTLSASGHLELRDVRRLLSAPLLGVSPGSDMKLDGSIVLRVELADAWLAFEELGVEGSWEPARPMVLVDLGRIIRATLSSVLLLTPLLIIWVCSGRGIWLSTRREEG